MDVIILILRSVQKKGPNLSRIKGIKYYLHGVTQIGLKLQQTFFEIIFQQI